MEHAYTVRVSIKSGLLLSAFTANFEISWHRSTIYPSLFSSDSVIIQESTVDVDVLFYNEDDDDWRTDVNNVDILMSSRDTSNGENTASVSLAIADTRGITLSPAIFRVTLNETLMLTADATVIIPYSVELWSGIYFYLDGILVTMDAVNSKLSSNCVHSPGDDIMLPPCPMTVIQAMIDGRYSEDSVSSLVDDDDTYEKVHRAFFHGDQTATCYRSLR